MHSIGRRRRPIGALKRRRQTNHGDPDRSLMKPILRPSATSNRIAKQQVVMASQWPSIVVSAASRNRDGAAIYRWEFPANARSVSDSTVPSFWHRKKVISMEMFSLHLRCNLQRLRKSFERHSTSHPEENQWPFFFSLSLSLHVRLVYTLIGDGYSPDVDERNFASPVERAVIDAHGRGGYFFVG